jgi:hypothetical protein
MANVVNCCPDDFVKQYIPEVEKVQHYEGERWEFPSGFGIAKARKIIARVWPLMSGDSKAIWLRKQLVGGLHYVQECVYAYDHAGIKLDYVKIKWVQNLWEILKVLPKDSIIRKVEEDWEKTHRPNKRGKSRKKN